MLQYVLNESRFPYLDHFLISQMKYRLSRVDTVLNLSKNIFRCISRAKLKTISFDALAHLMFNYIKFKMAFTYMSRKGPEGVQGM